MSKHRPLDDTQMHSVETGWSDAILLCKKCSKKLKGGFGPDKSDTLKQALRVGLRERGQRGQVGLIEVGCLGICPKRAVTIAKASQPGQLLIVPVNSPVETVLGLRPAQGATPL